MRKFLYSTAAAVAMTGSAFLATPASAGAFCSTQVDGQSFRSCNHPTYASCARTVSGAGGQCVSNPGWRGGYGGYEDSYAYAPGPAYGYHDDGPGYYRRPGIGITIGAY